MPEGENGKVIQPSELQDSLEFGAASKDGKIKVYLDFKNMGVAEIQRIIDKAKIMRDYAMKRKDEE